MCGNCLLLQNEETTLISIIITSEINYPHCYSLIVYRPLLMRYNSPIVEMSQVPAK